MRFPRLYAAASLKHEEGYAAGVGHRGFPRLYAAASLKHAHAPEVGGVIQKFSAALCRGLIEARAVNGDGRTSRRVFRGSMPRPH